MQKRIILDAVLGSPELRNNEALYHCPKCNHHKKKLSINIPKGVFKCWICDFSGKNLDFLVKKYGSYDQYMEWAALTPSYYQQALEDFTQKCEQRVVLPEGFVTLCTNSPRSIHMSALNYLASRGVDKGDILRWKMGFCYKGKFQGRIIVPSFSDKGRLNYFIARSYVNSKTKYLNPAASKNIVFNDLMIDWASPVILVEGIFDAIRIPNSIPILGSTLHVESAIFQKILQRRADVYIALDSDAQQKEEKIIKNLLLHGVNVHKIEVPFGRDLGDLSKEECSEIKQKARFVESVDYLLYRKILGGI